MIPATWKKATIGELCQMVKGKSPTMKTKPGEYPLVTMGEEHKTADSYQLDTEAVCVPMISSFGHGKAGLKRVHYIKGKFALSNILTALVVKEPHELSAKYLALYLQTFKDQLIVPLQTGAANMSLRPEKLATVPVYFPSLKEQDSITSLVNEVESIKNLRMQSQNRIDALMPSIYHEMFGDPLNDKKKYDVRQLGEIMKVNSGKFLPSKDMRTEGGFPVYGGNGINGFHDEYMFEKPVIVIGRVGYYCGSVYLTKPKSWITDNALYVSEIKTSDILDLYLMHTLRVLNLNQFSSIAAQPLISASRIYPIRITIPPVKLQIQFIEAVDEVEKIKEALLKSDAHMDKIYDSVLSNAFWGKLN